MAQKRKPSNSQTKRQSSSSSKKKSNSSKTSSSSSNNFPKQNLLWAALLCLVPFIAILVYVKVQDDIEASTSSLSVGASSASADSNVIEVNNESVDDFDLPSPPIIVNWKEGGWPQSLVNQPFKKTENVFCYTQGCLPDQPFQGYDWHSEDESIKRCEVKKSPKTNDELLSLFCEDEYANDQEATPIYYFQTELHPKCCERLLENDLSIYKHPASGLHYGSRYDPDFQFWAIDKLANDYPEANYSDGTTLLLHYQYHIDDDVWGYKHYSIPYRVQKSSTYKTKFHNLVRTVTYQIDNKILLAAAILKEQKKLEINGQDGVRVFPKTYTNCLDAVQSPGTYEDTLFYIKEAHSTRGQGIKVMTRGQIKYHNDNPTKFNSMCQKGKSVIQEAVTDLQTVSGKRFDIRFYFMTHQGEIYMHDYAVLMYIEDPENPQMYDPFDAKAMVGSARRDSKTARTVRAYSHEQPELWKDWITSIRTAMVHAQPVMEKILDETSMDHKSYQIWGGDAMITADGNVIFPEFNDWPNIHYSIKADGSDEKQYKSKLVENASKGSFWNSKEEKYSFGPIQKGNLKNFYYDFVGRVYADFYSILLGLATESEDGVSCDGRVSRIMIPSSSSSGGRSDDNASGSSSSSSADTASSAEKEQEL